MQTLRVQLAERSYDVAVLHDGNARLGAFAALRSPARRALVVTDDRVEPHLGGVMRALQSAGFDAASTLLPHGETTKSLNVAATLYDRLIDLGADRKTLIVALGGGVVGDLAGYVAATFLRGLPLLMIPTTLLAAVDSSVGGKVGVNHPRGKNLIGAFHQPVGVWIDTAFLATLPPREFRSGLGEVVKYGLSLDANFFTWLETNSAAILRGDADALEHIILHGCRLKAGIVEQDEREETGLRAVLNLGHTFAHAFETIGGYGTWLHGEAVAAGLVCACRLAERQRLIGPDITDRVIDLLRKFLLPVAPLAAWPALDLLDAMRRDKKTLNGRLRFVLPTRLGHALLHDDVPESLVRAVLEEAIR